MRGPKLSLKQEGERWALRETLGQLLGHRRLRDFDDERFVGTHEDVDGVQWHVGLDRERFTRSFAVNLEGLSYGNTWPIAKFLWREAQELRLVDVAREVVSPERVHVHLTRDAWASTRQRVAIDNWYIVQDSLDRLVREPRRWKDALVKAKNCLRGPNGGRGAQSVTTWRRHGREELEVCPHLTIGVLLDSTGSLQDRVLEMGAAKRQLEPLYTFVVAACR